MPRKKKKPGFLDLYTPVVFRGTANGTWDGLETFGDDLDRVKRFVHEAPKRVWTVLDCDGDLYTVAGYHYVNRIHYIITEQEWTSPDECYPFESDFCGYSFEQAGGVGSDMYLKRK